MAIVVFLHLILILVGVVVGMTRGLMLIFDRSRNRKGRGLLVFLASFSVPWLVCCVGPSVVFRVYYGRPPLDRYTNHIKEGWPAGDVERDLGRPHERSRRGEEEHWMYYLDSLTVGYFAVDFGPGGRVIRIHRD